MALALRAASLRSPVQIGSPADLSNPRGSSSHHPERRSPRTRGLLCSGAGDGKDSGHPWPSPCGRPRCAHPSKSAVLPICRTHVGPHPITRNDEAPARGGFFVLERVMGIEPTFVAWEATVLPLNYTRAQALRDKCALRSHTGSIGRVNRPYHGAAPA